MYRTYVGEYSCLYCGEYVYTTGTITSAEREKALLHAPRPRSNTKHSPAA